MWKIIRLGCLGNENLIVVYNFSLTFTCRFWLLSLLFDLNHVLWPRINFRIYVIVYVLGLHDNVFLYWIPFFIQWHRFGLERFADFKLIKHFLVILFNFALLLESSELFDVIVSFLLKESLNTRELIWGDIVLLLNWLADALVLWRFKSWCKVTVLMLDNFKWFFWNLPRCSESVHLILLSILVNLRDLVSCC